MADLAAFRAEARQWIERNYPASLRAPLESDEDASVWGGRRASYAHPDQKLWLERMGAVGWTVPTWPKEYGGGGLSREEAKVLEEELRRAGCRPALVSFGISMLGPVLLEYGSEAQKREHLPKIVRGEIRWCQGYSEPGAGSDLASLGTRAVRDGDQYVVTGQKVWTSYANYSDWIFCLVRTKADGPKHDGISFLLIDMDSPGVSTAPIKLISGSSPFCQTFFENVRVPVANRVGPENGGWTIAKRLLQHERSMISGMGSGIGGPSATLPALARKYLGTEQGRVSDAFLRDRIAQVEMDRACFGATLRRSADAARAGKGPGPESSMFKLYGTELNKRRAELAVEVAGAQALGWEGPGFSEDEIALTRGWLRSKGNSIEGGTSEVQLNIIAKRVLGLPD
jgi:alkylation response protein AidB-like acyl-CoA dehydrogenase